MDNDTYDDRTNIRFLKQEEFNANVVKRLEEVEDYLNRPKLLDDQVNIKLMKQDEWNEKVIERLDQGIENRTKAFSRIEALEGFKYDTNIKLERIDDILVVHKNQTDNQRKNFCALRRVLDDKVMDLIEKGEHGKQE
tara:strand:+ start:145 stop:555 length:411 start_codon:yes stop_codon:yes gene_type:complete